MFDIHPDEWTTIEESIREDLGADRELKNRFNDAGVRIDAAMEIFEIRKGQKLTESQFAEILGIAPDRLAKLEGANFTEPPDKILEWVHEKIEQWNKVRSDLRLSSGMKKRGAGGCETR